MVFANKWDFPGGTSGKVPACLCRRQKRLGFDPWGGKMPWRRNTPVLLPGESHGQRNLAGYSPQGCKEPDTTEAKKYRYVYILINKNVGFPGDSVVTNPPVNAEDMGSVPGSVRSPGAGNGNPLQCSCLENPIDRGAWWATVHGVAKS